MRFALTEEQQMIRTMVRDFAEKELRPIAREIDEEERFPEESISKLAQLGLMGMTTPKEYGGAGTDNVSYSIAIEEISRVCAATGTIVSVNNSLVCEPINKYGTEEQKQKYLVPLAKGEKIGAFALTEPNAGSDAASQKTVCKKEGDGYILDGAKNFVSLMFHKGAEIPGDHPRLEGDGKQVRTMRFDDLEDLSANRNDLAAVIKAWCESR